MRFKRTMIKKSLMIITTTKLITKNQKKNLFFLERAPGYWISAVCIHGGLELNRTPGRPTLWEGWQFQTKKKIKTTKNNNNNHNQMVWKDYIFLGIYCYYHYYFYYFRTELGILRGWTQWPYEGRGADSCYNFFFPLMLVLMLYSQWYSLSWSSLIQLRFYIGVDHDKYWR